MEEEFVAASKAAQELLGARELFRELKITVKEPMILGMDNQEAIIQFLNEATSIKAKHIDDRLKYVRQYMDKGIIAPTYVHTSKMLADLHTMAFSTSSFSI
uniref:AlNc14C1061G12749 protein n=1 Tax=Albugo laibachii Nc14 TaxID=890382 RepID=F0X2H2_9STRA|nr:AlNc14C1061G12749 [Albugo laibachii Nc14]|eukprot:CCA28069.1 AlNc14C1061G12749 [Albugo laibachii Nc14]